MPQELHRSLQKAEQALGQVLGSVQQLWVLLSVHTWGDAAVSCSFPLPKLGFAGVVGVLEQLEGNGMAW